MAARPAAACVYPPPPPPLPGETEQAQQERLIAGIKEQQLAGWKLAEAQEYGEGSAVFFGRIVKSEEIPTSGSKYGRRVVVEPLYALKGSLPADRQILQTKLLTSCGFEGGGRAIWGSVGDLAVVFEGIRPIGLSNLTTDSVLAKDVQDEQLVAALRKWIADRPLYAEDQPK